LRLLNGRPAVSGLTDHADVLFIVKKQAESFEEYGVVIHQKDSDGHGNIPWFRVQRFTGLGNKILQA
jgi:hypothetical protein